MCFTVVAQSSGVGDDSALEMDVGSHLDGSTIDNYRMIQAVLTRMTQLCAQELPGGAAKPRKHEQRLLRNMGAHVAVLDLLRIPYDKVMPVAHCMF